MTAEQLKASLLQMAIIGKLVPQLEDESAVDIDSEELEEVPFTIPAKWKWVRLGSISTIVRGGSPRPIQNFLTSRSDGINWIKIGDSTRGQRYITQCKEKIIPEGKTKSRFVKAGSLILSNSMSFGYPYILKIDGCIHDGWLSISEFEKHLFVEFAYIILLSPYCRSRFTINAAGAVVKNLNIEKVEKLYIPVPPLSEQRRIVARLNELLSIVEEYGKSQSALHVLKTELPGKLRASLLQQATMGKLVPQLDEEPAVDIDSEELEEVPFAIPEKWKWVKIKNLVTPCEQKIPDRDFLYIDVSSIDNIHHKIRPALKILQPHEAPSRARKIVKQGMVLYSTVRPYLLNTCIVDAQMHDEMICSTAFVAVTCSDKLISSYFLSVLLSPCFISYVLSVQKGVTYPAITDKNFYDAVIPLPPLAEQRRIVARLNAILPFFEAMTIY